MPCVLHVSSVLAVPIVAYVVHLSPMLYVTHVLYVFMCHLCLIPGLFGNCSKYAYAQAAQEKNRHHNKHYLQWGKVKQMQPM